MGCEGDPVPRAVEKTHTQIGLQRFDLERDGGLSEKKVLGGFAKTELFGDRAENLQAEIFQLSHGEDYLWKSGIVTEYPELMFGAGRG